MSKESEEFYMNNMPYESKGWNYMCSARVAHGVMVKYAEHYHKQQVNGVSLKKEIALHKQNVTNPVKIMDDLITRLNERIIHPEKDEDLLLGELRNSGLCFDYGKGIWHYDKE